MNNKAIVGISIASGALIGALIGIGSHRIAGSWVGIGVAIGAAVGLAITRGRNK
jgi:hypothetical protein